MEIIIMTFHRLELIVRTWQSSGATQALDVLRKSLRDAVKGQHRTLFAMTGDFARGLPATTNRHLDIARYDEWSAIPASVQNALITQKRYLWWDTEAMLATGAELWVGFQEAQPLTFSMTRRGDRVDVYFFPMTETCSLISHCVTLPEARGQGLYVDMLRHISQTLAEDRQNRLYIDCTDFNFASERGIYRAGFRTIGRGVHRRSGTTVWWQETPPSVTRLEAADQTPATSCRRQRGHAARKPL
ncbi:hypothetical protein EYC08_19150 [Tabrizicola sp. WMC-M-20]|nr:hypothetical protein EYC08_19150 [Tabrizicola sp. WMC-M-20]